MKNLCLALSLFTFIGCASAAPEFKPDIQNAPSSASSIEAKQLAAQVGATEVAEIDFIPQTTKLTTLSERLLKQSLSRALERGPIERIAVVTWGDEEYPSVHDPKLSKEQRRLVDARNYAIKEYLRQYDEKPIIRLYSMAERPGTVDKWIGDREWKIKKALEESGVPNTDTSVKVPSKASKAIILFKNVKYDEKDQH